LLIIHRVVAGICGFFELGSETLRHVRHLLLLFGEAFDTFGEHDGIEALQGLFGLVSSGSHVDVDLQRAEHLELRQRWYQRRFLFLAATASGEAR